MGYSVTSLFFAVSLHLTVIFSYNSRLDGVNYEVSAILVIILRVLSGLSCGAVSPAMFSLLGKWIPTYERSQLTVITLSGQMVRLHQNLSVYIHNKNYGNCWYM